MKKFCFPCIVFILFLGFSSHVRAQLLDDEDVSTQLSTDSSEALFEEMFSDFPETERDITKVKTFDDAVEVISQGIKKDDTANDIQQPEVTTPLLGEMLIGIQKDSFKIFRDMSGRSRCSFNVALKSDLEKDIKLLAVNLVYSQKVFAFVFKDIPSKQTQFRHITTGGDICYKMAGITPDINIHKCKIRATLAADCINHIKWSDNLE